MRKPPPSHLIDHEGINWQEWIAQTRAHRASYRRLAHKIARLFPLTGGRVLDFGCGNGVLLALLAERWPHTVAMTGMDIDRRLIAWAQEQFATGRLAFQHVEPLAEPTPEFDLVLSTFVSHHWDDVDAFLRHTLGYARPGGSVYVEDIDPDSLFSRLLASRLYYLLFRPARTDFLGYRQSRASAFSAAGLRNALQAIEGIDYRVSTRFGRTLVHIHRIRSYQEAWSLTSGITPPTPGFLLSQE